VPHRARRITVEEANRTIFSARPSPPLRMPIWFLREIHERFVPLATDTPTRFSSKSKPLPFLPKTCLQETRFGPNYYANLP